MKIDYLDEPDLEFGSGYRHIDIRHGLMNAGPLDILSPKPRSISVAIIGTNQTIEGLGRWLERCRNEVPAKASEYPRLFPRFPGFAPDVAFHSTLLLENRMQRPLSERSLSIAMASSRPATTVQSCVAMFLEELNYLAETHRPDVVICAPTNEMWESFHNKDIGTGFNAAQTDVAFDFHDLLKAKGMKEHVPLQLVWPYTYDPGKRRRQKRRTNLLRGQQDEATRAWNLHTALYYKAGGTPWRLIRDPTRLTTCFVGVAFFQSLAGDRLMTSLAQLFNERGEGVVVRGGTASVSKDDLQPHLDQEGAKQLLHDALTIYRREHKTVPARLVLHKTSKFSHAEMSGFREALLDWRIESADLLSISDSETKLFREQSHPPLRGTFLSLDARTHVFYTRGSVDFFQVYPGQYIPSPLLIRCEDTEQTPRFLAAEILELTKMNWNTTQFDGRDPITTRAAHHVGAILKYLEPTDVAEAAYAFYM